MYNEIAVHSLHYLLLFTRNFEILKSKLIPEP